MQVTLKTALEVIAHEAIIRQADKDLLRFGGDPVRAAYMAHKAKRAASAGGVLASFEFVASNSGNSTTITYPGGIQAGDLGVIFNAGRGASSAPALVTPADHDVLANHARTDASFYLRGAISAKILLGSETTVSGMDGTGTSSADLWIVAVFRPNAPFTGFTANSVNGQGTGSNPTAQTITASGATPPILLLGQMASSAAISPRTRSPTMDELTGSGTDHYAHYLLYNNGDTPVDHSYDMDDEGSQVIQSLYLTFT